MRKVQHCIIKSVSIHAPLGHVKFQFHIGLIRSQISLPVALDRLQFQFHIGLIRSSVRLRQGSGSARFNSTLV